MHPETTSECPTKCKNPLEFTEMHQVPKACAALSMLLIIPSQESIFLSFQMTVSFNNQV